MLSYSNIKDHFVWGSTNIAIMLVEMVDELFTKEPAIPSTKYDGCLRITRDCA